MSAERKIDGAQMHFIRRRGCTRSLRSTWMGGNQQRFETCQRRLVGVKYEGGISQDYLSREQGAAQEVKDRVVM